MSMRPLLFERESQTNAKLKANRRYQEILRDAGIDENDLDTIMNHQIVTPIKQMSIDENYDKSSEKSSDLRSRENSNREVSKSNIPSEDEVSSDQDNDFKDSIADNKKADHSNISESEDRAFSANDDDSNDENSSGNGSYKQV